MKTEEEILARIHREVQRMGRDGGRFAAMTRGWIDALEWVLGRDD